MDPKKQRAYIISIRLGCLQPFPPTSIVADMVLNFLPSENPFHKYRKIFFRPYLNHYQLRNKQGGLSKADSGIWLRWKGRIYVAILLSLSQLATSCCPSVEISQSEKNAQNKNYLGALAFCIFLLYWMRLRKFALLNPDLDHFGCFHAAHERPAGSAHLRSWAVNFR